MNFTKQTFSAGGSGVPYLHVREERAVGTNKSPTLFGATIDKANFRNLNTTIANTINGAVLADDAITLDAGTYRIDASVPVFAVAVVERMQGALVNVTDSVIILWGTSEYLTVGAGMVGTSKSLVKGRFTLSKRTALKLATFTMNGSSLSMGYAISLGSNSEVNAICEIWKE